MRRFAAVVAIVGVAADEALHCAEWAQHGECQKNADFMNQNCLAECAAAPKDAQGEPEQCIGWANQGECTRNPKYMKAECPNSCMDQRKKMHEGALDDRIDCLDVAVSASTCQQPAIAAGCKGTCTTRALCEDEADPAECAKALRCRELKDEWSDCASRVEQHGCEDPHNAVTLLKHCYLSCARVGRVSLLRRYRKIYTVRTRAHSLIDEDKGSAWRAAGANTWSVPCWHGTLFDPPPPATCVSSRGSRLRRWRQLAHPRCRELRDTTPRAPPRRTVTLPAHLQPSRELSTGLLGGVTSAVTNTSVPPVRVLPLLLSPKVRLVEDFLTPEEAAHVIEVGVPHMHRSLAGGRTESIRTSTTGMLPAHDPVVRRITERAALITGYPYENIEPLQLVKYTDGQRYEPHFDYGEACDFEENINYGHRHVYAPSDPLSNRRANAAAPRAALAESRARASDRGA